MSKPFRDFQHAVAASAPEACDRMSPQSMPPEALTAALDSEWESELLESTSIEKPQATDEPLSASRALTAAKNASRAAVAARARRMSARVTGLVSVTALPPAQRRDPA